MSDNPYLDRFDAIDKVLAAITAKLAGVTPPGAVPTTASVLPWTRNPGAPVVPGVMCYGNRAEALRYAAQGYGANGIRAALDVPLPAALDRADRLLAATTSDESEAIVMGTKYLDPDTAAYCSLVGWVAGGSLGGTPYVTVSPDKSLASLIAEPGTIIGGNVAGV